MLRCILGGMLGVSDNIHRRILGEIPEVISIRVSAGIPGCIPTGTTETNHASISGGFLEEILGDVRSKISNGEIPEDVSGEVYE